MAVNWKLKHLNQLQIWLIYVQTNKKFFLKIQIFTEIYFLIIQFKVFYDIIELNIFIVPKRLEFALKFEMLFTLTFPMNNNFALNLDLGVQFNAIFINTYWLILTVGKLI